MYLPDTASCGWQARSLLAFLSCYSCAAWISQSFGDSEGDFCFYLFFIYFVLALNKET